MTNQHYIHEEIKDRLNSANSYHHSVQNPLSSLLLSKINHNFTCRYIWVWIFF